MKVDVVFPFSGSGTYQMECKKIVVIIYSVKRTN
jgi:hypothetical protein